MTVHARRGWRAAGFALASTACGIAGAHAWDHGLWGLLTGAVLAAPWLAGLAWWNAARVPQRAPGAHGGGPAADYAAEPGAEPALMQRLLLDAAPTPLVAVVGDTARALNRAARTVFGADDRIVPAPVALVDPGAGYLRHEGRRWRIDRVSAPGGGMTMAALIDVEREERAAEARASAELIEILGHELLNGLAPIVSLAESAQAAAAQRPVEPALLDEILGPLARRADGLQRFAAAYRELARLPEPSVRPVALPEFAQDLARAFAGRWPAIALAVRVPKGCDWAMDGDQMGQAVWALLHNAAEAAEAAEAAGTAGAARVGLAIAPHAGRLAITVTDSGAGVPPASAAHIFRPFHTTKAGGSGIGLSLARQIARAHGGTLDLASADPTAFRLTVPG